VAEQFEIVAAVEEGHWWFVALRERVAAELSFLRPGMRVLDAGCGTGRVLAELPEWVGRVGLDANPAVLEVARRRPGITFVEGSIEALPFEDASFDAVISLDVLSDARVGDPRAGARELRRVLRPGGVAVVNLPAYEWLRSSHDEVAQTGRRHTARSARALLRDGGFGAVRARYRVSALFPAAAARRLLPGGGTDVGEVSPRLNRLLLRATRAEPRLPFGLSVLAVASADAPAPGVVARAYARALHFRGLVHAAQFAVTGEWTPRRQRLLGEEIARGKHDFVLDLGCGAAPVLRFFSPQRYVGVDEHGPSLEEGRREHAGPGREFVQAPLGGLDLVRWRGADAVVVSSVCHHLDDAAVVELMERIAREAEPGRILLQDAEPTGPLGPLVSALDDGDHLRPKADLVRLLEPRFHVREGWTYDNPVRSFHQFLLELKPR
jgi:ubiquinone/menaquinone biosynthesis C-methylase UbiE